MEPQTRGDAFVGRQHELSVLRRHVEMAGRGEGGVVLVAGEAGIGKTRLLREVAEYARRTGHRLLAGQGRETGVPFALLSEALRPHLTQLPAPALRRLAGEAAPDLGRMVPEVRDRLEESGASGVAPGGNDAGGAPEGRYRLFERLSELLVRLSNEQRGGLVLVLDDLQWADHSTLLLLAHLTTRIRHAPLLVAGGYRTTDADAAADAAADVPDPLHPLHSLRAAAQQEGCPAPIVLTRFSAEETAALVAEIAGAGTSPQVVEAIQHRTQGNPLFVREVVRHLGDVAASPSGAGTAAALRDVPYGIRQVIHGRLARLRAETRRTLQAAAVTDGELEVALLARLAGMDEEAVLAALEEGLAAGLLTARSDRVSFSHDLIRETLYDALSLPRRQRLHLRAAQAIEAEGTTEARPAAALARHYLLAGPGTDRDRAIDYALRAADAAQASFGFEEAAAHWRAALELLPADGAAAERRAGVLERLGDLLYQTGLDFGEGIRRLEEALRLRQALGQPGRAAEVHALLGRAFAAGMSETQDLTRALHHYRAAEAALVGGPPRAGLVRVYAGLSLAAWYLHRTDEGRLAAERGLEIADAIGDESLQAYCAIFRGIHLVQGGRLREGFAALEEAAAVAERLDQPFLGFLAAIWHAAEDLNVLEPRTALALVEAELGKARLAQAPIRRATLHHRKAQALLELGEIERAREAAAWTGYQRGMVEAVIAYRAGEWGAAERLAQQERERLRRMGSSVFEAEMAQVHARVCIGRGGPGDQASAALLLEEALAIVAGGGLPAEVDIRVDLALLALDSGPIDEAERHVARCREVVADPAENWRGLAGRVALAEGAVAAAQGRAVAAEAAFERALATFRRYGLAWGEAAARARLRALKELEVGANGSQGHVSVPRSALPAGLTPREVDVLRRLASGMSNAQIAEELVLSVRTVERHIDGIYGKLGLSGKSARAVAAGFALTNGLVDRGLYAGARK